ncbi:tyrosine-type recombinase/integrase [Azohydromonas aeria]|uniref:tyrosine-type recombinase/integrase n=1 Tax=Azohydromonas aeria TaxID=2590212 RepID=UPI0012F85D6B|nr:tyrosine-type recombinase/integrase [Azohydromonas aeria]
MSTPLPTGAVEHSISAYLEHQRALGRAYQHEEDILKSLSRCLALAGAQNLDLAVFDQWCASLARLNATVRRNHQRTVYKWCLYRRREDPSCFVPDPNRFPRAEPYIAPVIVSPEAVARMLDASNAVLATPDSPLRPHVLRLATALLYSAGLRRGELLRLELGDVNMRDAVLRIRESKFHKSRWVPLSSDAGAELRHYLQRCQRQWGSQSPETPLLCHGARRCSGYTGTGLSRGLHELMDAAAVRGWDGRRPRLHDLRHSFAVQCLLRWYRQGADVQSQLPKLAMYMGHVSIVSTAYYLRWIPELAQAASDRFESRFGALLQAQEAP